MRDVKSIEDEEKQLRAATHQRLAELQLERERAVSIRPTVSKERCGVCDSPAQLVSVNARPRQVHFCAGCIGAMHEVGMAVRLAAAGG